jgi:hypothetical protein
MGYTHYFTFRKPAKGQAKTIEIAYQRAIADCQRVIKRYYADHGGLSGYSAHTAIGAYGGINVNGKGDDGHETFALREHFSQNLDSDAFNFCKTARKPYDLVVTACLAILKHRLGDCVTVSSDGRASDWAKGVAYARKFARLSIQNPIDDMRTFQAGV